MRLRDRAARLGRPARGGIGIGAIDMAEQAVRRALLLLGGGAGGEHAQIRIDLHRIRVDHDAAMLLGQRQRERGLAARGRPCDERHQRQVRGSDVHCDAYSRGFDRGAAFRGG